MTGLNDKSDPQLPLLSNAFTESVGVYTDDESRKGGVFLGEKCAWVTVSGSAKASELSPGSIAKLGLPELAPGSCPVPFLQSWGNGGFPS